ncbi:MAG: CinA family protein [Nocardioides sp.]
MTATRARPLPVQVRDLLREGAATVSTAESLTGGRVAARLTSVPGASAVYRGGVVAYATDVKVSVLGVPEAVVAEHGVVSVACARAMARGVRALTGSTYGLATTGVAGPSSQEGKAVGTVYVGLCGPGSEVVLELALTGDRATIVGRTVDEALTGLLDLLSTRVDE